jgi:WD40 repeat protein/serine/threonine protein kinase
MSVNEESVFAEALEIQDSQERAAYLDRACAGNPGLRRIVESLLAAYEEGQFLESPAPGLADTVDEQRVREGPGTVIGPYKLMEQIGEGGMGLVFVAEQQQPLRRRVALKLIKPGMDTREVIARFEAERQALALMDHPHIARVLDGGQTSSGRPYFVMDLVKGLPLTEYCDQAQLTPRERLELFVHLCQAVQHAHQKGVIHRDLKPSNVLVALHDGTPVVKVIDFGVAKALGQELTDKTLFTGFAQLIGTPLYMSPEQAGQSSLDIDTRSDIYSLGVLLYELLTGTTPFDRERLRTVSFDEIRRIICEEEPAKPSTLLSSSETLAAIATARQTEPVKLTKLVRGDLDWIVMKALEKDRARRYETSAAFAADVERYLHDEPVLACPPSVGYRLRKFARRNKAALVTATAVAAAVLLALAGLAVSTVLIAREQQATAKALTAETQANADLKQALERERQNAYYQRIALAEREWAANNLGRMQRLLDECPEDLRGWEWHYLKGLRYNALPPLRHEAAVLCAVFSPDGRRIASSDQEGWVKVWDAQTGQELLKFRAHQQQARAVAFSPDGRRLATASWDGWVRTWDAQTGQALPLCKHIGGQVGSVAFSPDGRYLASGRSSAGGSGVKVWDAATGDDVVTLRGPHKAVYGIAFSPDGRRLAATGPDPDNSNVTVTVWDVLTWRKQLTFGHAANASVAFSPDSRLLSSGSQEQAARVSDAQTGQELFSLRGHTAGVSCVAFSPDGRRLASGSGDVTIKLWDVQTGQEVLTLRGGHSGGIFWVAFSPDGHRLVSASADRTVRVWEATPARGEPDQGCLTLRGHAGEVNTVAFHPKDPRLLASAGRDGTIRLWDAGSGELLRTLNAHPGNVAGLAFSPDGQRLASAGRDMRLRVWDATKWQEVPPWPRDINSGGSVAFSPDGRLLASARYAQKSLRIWDAATGQVKLELPNPWVTASVAFSPDGRHLASANYDGTVRVWDVKTRKEVVRSPLRHGGFATSVAFSRDGRRLASGSRDETVKVWDTTTWEPRLVLSDPTGRVQSVAFSPDGRCLAWGSTDSTVKVWDEAGARIHTLRGHTGWVNSVAFSRDGVQIASASADGTVRIWKAPR